jgi:hypothetical protein
MKNFSFIKFLKEGAKYFLFPLLFSSSGFAQVNLIPNGDFEDLARTTLDSLFYGINPYMPPWNGTNCFWNMGVEPYSERFTPSLMWPWRVPINIWGKQYAQSGDSYAGFFIYRPYPGANPNNNPAWNFLGNKLTKPLQPGLPYYFSFYFNLADKSGLAINKISVHFTQDSTLCRMDSASYLFYSPFEPLIRADTNMLHTDSIFWTHTETVFTSDSAVQMMYVGCLDKYYQVKFDTVNSTSDPNTSYYYFDNFELYELQPYLGRDTSLCPNDSGYLISAHRGFDHYLWNTGDTGRTLRVYNSGQYWVKATWQGQHLYDTIQVNFFPLPQAQLQTYSFIVSPGTMQLQSSGDYKNYLWSTGATSSSITTNATGLFWLQATTADGCMVYDTLTIEDKNLALIIPSIVAPNEAFTIKNLPPNCRLSIFNEAGQIVYLSDNFQNCCVPKLAAGMYFVDLILNDGSRRKNKVIFY